jgi:hypothetical protein
MTFFKLENFYEAKRLLNFFFLLIFSKFNKESENDENIFINFICIFTFSHFFFNFDSNGFRLDKYFK